MEKRYVPVRYYSDVLIGRLMKVTVKDIQDTQFLTTVWPIAGDCMCMTIVYLCVKRVKDNL